MKITNKQLASVWFLNTVVLADHITTCDDEQAICLETWVDGRKLTLYVEQDNEIAWVTSYNGNPLDMEDGYLRRADGDLDFSLLSELKHWLRPKEDKMITAEEANRQTENTIEALRSSHTAEFRLAVENEIQKAIKNGCYNVRF